MNSVIKRQHFRLAIGNMSNSVSELQMERVKIFLHSPNKFMFFEAQDHMPNNYKISSLILK